MDEILRKLVAFHTVDGDEPATHQALDYIADFVALRGMHVERFDLNGAESLLATTQAGRKTPKVLLAAHLDVVPADDELFVMREADGKLYGRGVLDMKCAIAAYLQIIDELQHELQDYDFGMMITTDEEAGGLSVPNLIAEGYMPGVCILPDGGDKWQIQTYSKGFLFLKLTTEGTPAHGSRPWLGKSALLPLLAALQDVQALFPDMSAETNTCNIGIVQAGEAGNQVPAHGEALVDIRLASEAERAGLLKIIDECCVAHGVTMHIQLSAGVAEFSLDDPLITPFARIITDVTGVEVTGSRTLGSNDARYFAAVHVPCISFYPIGGGHHGPDEWLDKRAFGQMKEIISAYLEKVAKQD